MFGYHSSLFGLAEIVFPIVFLLALGIVVAAVVRNIATWNRNNHSPRLTVAAKVVAKRMKVQHGANGGGVEPHGGHSGSFTYYYVTFQVESGDRMELQVKGGEYGMLAEGDQGKLTFQGTRYLSFERT